MWLAVIAANELVIGSGVARMIFLTEYGPFFISGIIIHHLFAHGRSNTALALIAGSFAASCVTLQIGRVWMLDHYGQALSVPALIVANLFMHGLMIAAVRWRDIVRPSHTILLLGGLTYPLYLLHQNIGYIGINTIAPSVGAEIAVLIMVMVMLVTSWAVWRFIETPSRRWIIRTVQPVVSRFVYRKHTRSPVQPAE